MPKTRPARAESAPPSSAPPAPAPVHARPLSPHIQIYRWTLPMALSILHRLSGIALYGSMVLFAGFLWLLAGDGAAWAQLDAALRSPWGNAALVLAVWAFLHHLCGGVRHFIWDLGYGYGPRGLAALSWLTALVPLAGAALLWMVA